MVLSAPPNHQSCINLLRVILMYKISHFSKLTRLSPRILKHYDKLDILKPAFVDEESRCRYYSESQVQEAIEIIKLKKYEFSLSAIKEILHKNDHSLFHSMVKSNIEMIKREIGSKTHITEEMEMLLTSKHKSIIPDVEKCPIMTGLQPDRHVVRKRGVINIADIGRIAEELYNLAIDNCYHPYNITGAYFLSPEFEEENTEVDIFVPVKTPQFGGREKPGSNSDCIISVIPKHDFVTTIHMGSYDEIGAAYFAIEKWISKSGVQIFGDPYEVYLRSTESNVTESDFITQVSYPVIVTV